jgi:16S rRNA (cytosine1402-N4)-methyltransferase
MAHIPVLLKEVLEYLDPKPNQNFIDATVGDGGHAKEILKLTAPYGKFLAIDRDQDSIIRTRVNLEKFGKRVLFINDSFSNLKKIVEENKVKPVWGILFDFGMSSSQLEDSGRGFSFQKNEILDMRYDIKTPITAEDIINSYSEKELEEIFRKWGEEPKAKLIARAIIEARKWKRIKTTKELLDVIGKTVKKRSRLPARGEARHRRHPATLVFQALRIETNQELAEMEKALLAIPKLLKKGGRAAFISFHSLEDRLIKNWAKDLNKKGIIKILNKKPTTSSVEEIKINPRSRSAKLRVYEI